MEANYPTCRAAQIIFVLGLTKFPASGFDAHVYVVLDNFGRFFFRKVAHV
jgi:hypothetical protein